MRLIDADELEGYLKASGTDDGSLYSVDDLVRAVQSAPTVNAGKSNQNPTYAVFITESENCLRDWMEQSIPAISLHGLTLEEATLICNICARQSEPHDAVMKIENAQ